MSMVECFGKSKKRLKKNILAICMCKIKTTHKHWNIYLLLHVTILNNMDKI